MHDEPPMEELLKRELARERTARREAEHLLEQKSFELYQRNVELSAQAAELQRSNAELEQFAYVASHDLQAPLRGIIGFAQLLRRDVGGKLGKSADEYLGFIDEGAQRMRALINDILEFSRVGRRELALQPLSLELPLTTALSQLKTALLDAGAQIRHSELPTVKGDASALAQLLRNLIDNAVKYVRPGEPACIEIGAATEGSQVTVRVRDHGIGIPSAEAERVFQIFQRLHADEYPGTGVGLSICRKIVERHGGRIWIETPAEGGGVVFCFTLLAA